jgi:Mn-dependent DtxR family transcriptional regulator
MTQTQDFLSEMLSLRRATVSEAAFELRDAGLIDYTRGQITISDRPGLREKSCECYDLVKAANERLLPGRK